LRLVASEFAPITFDNITFEMETMAQSFAASLKEPALVRISGEIQSVAPTTSLGQGIQLEIELGMVGSEQVLKQTATLTVSGVNDDGMSFRWTRR
jgi:hypothetical protein